MSAAAFDTLATKADIFGLKRDLKELFAIGFAWYNHRTFSHLGWAFFKRTFVRRTDRFL